MSNPFTYTFYTDETYHSHNEVVLTHADYLKEPYLREMVHAADPGNMRLFLGRSLYLFSAAFLKDHKEALGELRILEHLQKTNPLRFYAPNSQEQLDFINDDDGTVFAIVDLNRSGKTTAGYIKTLLGDVPMLPCEKDWEVYADHGVKYREYQGPIACGVATYNVAKLGDPIWKEIIKKWTPDTELGIYGRTYKGRNKKYAPSWGHDRQTIFACGSDIGYYTYESDQGNFEGGALRKWLWDEQGRESQWDGADRGTRTTGGIHIFSLTPHKVVGRPDTGAGGFLFPMLTGGETRGHAVKSYTGTTIQDIPDWIYPESAKAIEIEKWEGEPVRTNNRKRIAEGRARLYGEWHRTGGLVLDDWCADLSWISPLWDRPPLEKYSIYRSMDHGYKHPFCCLWWAVDADGNIIIFREHYTTGQVVDKNVGQVVTLSGNRRRYLDSYESPTSGMILKRYEEIYEKEPVVRQALDGRSFTLMNDSVGKPNGWLYKAAGLKTLVKASGKASAHWVPWANQLLEPDESRKHIVTGEMGAPRIYVFSCCVNFKREIESWAWKESTNEEADQKELPQDFNNDAMTAFGYGLQLRVRKVGNFWGQQPGRYGEGGSGHSSGGRNRETTGLGYRRV